MKLDKGTPSNLIKDMMTNLSTKNDACIRQVTIILLILLTIIVSYVQNGRCGIFDSFLWDKLAENTNWALYLCKHRRTFTEA